MANEAVRHLKDAEFRAFLAEKNVALVDFWASWCGPCRMVAPTIEQLAQEYEGRANVGKVNVDEEGGLAGDFGVMSIPTVVLFKDGKEVERLVGVRTIEDYKACLRTSSAVRQCGRTAEGDGIRFYFGGGAALKRQNQTGSFVACA